MADEKNLKWISVLNDTEFESSSEYTQQFKSFYLLFNREFRSLLEDEFRATNIVIKRGHFESFGFFTMPSGQIWYFNLGDVRYDGEFMIRTAESYKDFTGGSNMFIDISSPLSFLDNMRRILEK